MPRCHDITQTNESKSFVRRIAKLGVCFRIVELEPNRFVVRICQGRSVY